MGSFHAEPRVLAPGALGTAWGKKGEVPQVARVVGLDQLEDLLGRAGDGEPRGRRMRTAEQVCDGWPLNVSSSSDALRCGVMRCVVIPGRKSV